MKSPVPFFCSSVSSLNSYSNKVAAAAPGLTYALRNSRDGASLPEVPSKHLLASFVIAFVPVTMARKLS